MSYLNPIQLASLRARSEAQVARKKAQESVRFNTAVANGDINLAQSIKGEATKLKTNLYYNRLKEEDYLKLIVNNKLDAALTAAYSGFDIDPQIRFLSISDKQALLNDAYSKDKLKTLKNKYIQKKKIDFQKSINASHLGMGGGSDLATDLDYSGIGDLVDESKHDDTLDLDLSAIDPTVDDPDEAVTFPNPDPSIDSDPDDDDPHDTKYDDFTLELSELEKEQKKQKEQKEQIPTDELFQPLPRDMQLENALDSAGQEYISLTNKSLNDSIDSQALQLWTEGLHALVTIPWKGSTQMHWDNYVRNHNITEDDLLAYSELYDHILTYSEHKPPKGNKYKKTQAELRRLGNLKEQFIKVDENANSSHITRLEFMQNKRPKDTNIIVDLKQSDGKKYINIMVDDEGMIVHFSPGLNALLNVPCRTSFEEYVDKYQITSRDVEAYRDIFNFISKTTTDEKWKLSSQNMSNPKYVAMMTVYGSSSSSSSSSSTLFLKPETETTQPQIQGHGIRKGTRPRVKKIQFGNYTIDRKKLLKNILSIQTQDGKKLHGFPNTKISDAVKKFFNRDSTRIINTKRHAEKLTPTEKAFISKLVDKLDEDQIAPSRRKALYDKESEELMNGLEILHGEIQAGNTSSQIKTQLDTILTKLVQTGKMTPKEARLYSL